MSTATTGLGSFDTLRDHIKRYLSVGVYNLIPLKHGTKDRPLLDWKHQKKRLPTLSEIASRFSRLCNIAVVLGETARLVAIDIDGDAAKQRVERKLVELGICNNLRVSMLDTMMTRTGSGGFHFVFYVSAVLFERYDLRTKTLWSGTSNHEEIKFMGEGSIVILAPSLHPSGADHYYQWNGKRPIELSEIQLKQLLELFGEKYLPTTLDEHNTTDNDDTSEPPVSSISAIRQGILGNSVKPTLSLSPSETQGLIKVLEPVYQTGKRNRITLGYAGLLRRRGYTLRSVEDFCVLVCKTFDDDEIESRLETVRRTFKKPLEGISGWGWLNDIG
jgi:hypothetical protein